MNFPIKTRVKMKTMRTMRMMKRMLWLAVLKGGLLLGLGGLAEAAEVAVMIGEDEYRTWETLPEFAKTELEPRGHRVAIVHADAADKNRFPGLEAALSKAEVLVVSVRRRTLPKEQMAALRGYVAAGKPVVGIRTASHAFALRAKDKLADESLAVWPEFDAEVLGGNYHNHHGGSDKTQIVLAPGAAAHPIFHGVRLEELVGNGTLYKNEPLASTATPLLVGSIPNQAPEPVAWTHRAGPGGGRVFYTSLGHAEDFKEAAFRRLLVNALEWALKK